MKYILMILLLSGCVNNKMKYKVGDIVYIKPDSQTAIITGVFPYHNEYHIKKSIDDIFPKTYTEDKIICKK